MSNLKGFTSKFRVQKTTSIETPPVLKATKRNRTNQACVQCKRSKTRCDRKRPCSNCSIRSEEDACRYLQCDGLTISQGLRNDAEERLSRLEFALKELVENQALQDTTQHLNQLSTAPQSVPSTDSDVSTGLSKKESENPTYVGSTHWSTILDDISQLRETLGGFSEIDEGDINDPSSTMMLGEEPIFGASNGFDAARIISEFLPSTIEVDRFLANYFHKETFILPIIHTHQFNRQYQQFRTVQAGANPIWLSILFSICYLASYTGEQPYNYQLARDDSVALCSSLRLAAGLCLVAGRYHRPQKYSVEALILYAQCKNLSSLDPSREAGAILGMAVRLAYEMGYHRDSTSFGNFSVFDGEIRRRTWAVCKQMDLMISFQLGLPSHVRLSDCDVLPPKNILDSDFDEDTQILPVSRPDSDPTRLLWFMVKDRMMVNFSKVCQGLLAAPEKSDAEISQLDTDIHQMRDLTPAILRVRPLSECITDEPSLILNRVFIEMIHLKSLCILHRKPMIRGNSYSTRACVNAAMSIVELFLDTCREFSLGGQLCSTRWMVTNFTVNDFLLGVMILCLSVHTRQKARLGRPPDQIEQDEKLILDLLRQSVLVCTENLQKSRDAKRVSYAIQLTLRGLSIQESTSCTDPLLSSIPSISKVDDVAYSDPELKTYTDVSGVPLLADDLYAIDYNATFGALDPFNFWGVTGPDIDWSLFDQNNWHGEGFT